MSAAPSGFEETAAEITTRTYSSYHTGRIASFVRSILLRILGTEMRDVH